MQEMFAALRLSAVGVATVIEMPLALFNSGTHIVDWHLAVIHLSIPNAEGSTKWRPDDPFRAIIGYHLARQLAVFTLAKVPDSRQACSSGDQKV